MNMAVRNIRRAHCTRTQHIELRLADVDDAQRIAQLLGVFFAETIWPDCLTFDAARAAVCIERGIRNRTQPFILAFDRGPKKFEDANRYETGVLDQVPLVGCVSWHLDNRFTDPIGVLDEVFVVPRLRRSDLGRRLIMLAVHVGKAEGAKVFNFPVASGMKQQASLINLLTRHVGAEPVGVILRKVL